MSEMDDTDKEILEILKKDSRKSFIDIGKRLKLSEGAVRRRVRNLVKRGIIKSFTIEVGYEYQLKALTFVSVDPSVPTPKVSNSLVKLNGVEAVYEITGEYDIVAIMAVHSMAQLNKCIEGIRNIQGVKETNTMIILRSVKE